MKGSSPAVGSESAQIVLAQRSMDLLCSPTGFNRMERSFPVAALVLNVGGVPVTPDNALPA